MASRINFVSPISLSKTKGITKGRWIRDREKIVGPLEIRHIECGDVEVENQILKVRKNRINLRVYIMKIAEATNPLLMKSDPSSGFPPKYL